MSTLQNRRHDDHHNRQQPATLRNFWKALYRLWWDFEDGFATAISWLVAALWVAIMLVAIGFSAYAFWFVWS